MTTNNNLTNLKLQLKDIVDRQQTCKLYVTDSSGSSWNFYCKKGKLLWLMESNYRFSRLHRLINKVAPNINCDKIKLREKELFELWEYLFIGILYKRQQINQQQAISIVRESIYEVFFDCLQASKNIIEIKAIFETSVNKIGSILRSPLFNQPITYIEIAQVGEKAEKAYNAWEKAGFSNYSPNLAPVITDKQKLQKLVDITIYDRLASLIDGQKSLRDLAIITKQDLLTFTISLLPYITSNCLELQEIEDKQLNNIYFYSTESDRDSIRSDKDPEREYIRATNLPLIVCIDDDIKIAQQMAQFLNPSGYRLIAVNESLQALIVLLENQADLIFLDAIMPLANGYEICPQIRKMSQYNKTPIIILNETDSIVDRLKTKMAGASDSICKPISKTQILGIVEKYIKI